MALSVSVMRIAVDIVGQQRRFHNAGKWLLKATRLPWEYIGAYSASLSSITEELRPTAAPARKPLWHRIPTASQRTSPWTWNGGHHVLCSDGSILCHWSRLLFYNIVIQVVALWESCSRKDNVCCRLSKETVHMKSL